MTRPLLVIGWILVAIDLIAAATLLFGRKSGDAATSAIGPGLGAILLAIGVLAAALLFWGGKSEGRSMVLIIACVVVAAPMVFTLVLSAAPSGVLGLIYPSMRGARTPTGPSAKYAFPDAPTRAAALAIIMTDWPKLDTLLRAKPAPNLTAHDELGQSLMGLATTVAAVSGGTMRDVEGLRMLIAAGGRPRADDLGQADNGLLIELLARTDGERGRAVIGMLIDAGLSPNSPIQDGRSVLDYQYLTPDAAAVFRARGAREEAVESPGVPLAKPDSN